MNSTTTTMLTTPYMPEALARALASHSACHAGVVDNDGFNAVVASLQKRVSAGDMEMFNLLHSTNASSKSAYESYEAVEHASFTINMALFAVLHAARKGDASSLADAVAKTEKAVAAIRAAHDKSAMCLSLAGSAKNHAVVLTINHHHS
jgi:hypothetical protein